jgi:alpha,alpha-trehalase
MVTLIRLSPSARGMLLAGAFALCTGHTTAQATAQSAAPAHTVAAPEASPSAAASAYPKTPHELFDGLFVAVQMAALYADGKAFPDAIPKSSPETILADYSRLQAKAPDALKAFVAGHFDLPSERDAAPALPTGAAITAHIDALWSVLTRTTSNAPRWSSLLPLPRPYVVPGGRFREMYYWDSYFTMLGLLESGRVDLVQGMVEDFASQIERYGHVPNGTRTYYLSRSQPPFFFLMVGLLNTSDPAQAYARFLPQLKREYAFWMAGADQLARGGSHRRVVAMPDGTVLNRYWDDRDTPRDESYREDTELARTSHRPPKQVYRDIRAAAESGWDFGSRWLADAHTLATITTTQIVPVDLNALLFGLEVAIRQGCERAHDEPCALEFAGRAERRRAAVDRYLWDERAGAYLDFQRTRGARIPRVSAATLYPLFTGMSSDKQAVAVGTTVRNALLRPGGIVTTPLETGQQWDAPNGWAPLQWIAVAGLTRYGKKGLAEVIACRWMLNVNDVYAKRGKLVEKYDVLVPGRAGGGGEYPLQDGFGWTNGVMRKLMALYPADANVRSPAQCPKLEDVTR